MNRDQAPWNPVPDHDARLAARARLRQYHPETPHGAWEFHETLIPNSPKKPLRIWMHAGDRDILITRDNYHDWVLANERMAKALAAKP